MKPKFQPQMQMRCLVCTNNKTEAAMARKFTNQKNQQLEEAVQYCMENNVREYKALQTAFFPLIKHKETINHRLDGKMKIGSGLTKHLGFTKKKKIKKVLLLDKYCKILQIYIHSMVWFITNHTTECRIRIIWFIRSTTTGCHSQTLQTESVCIW